MDAAIRDLRRGPGIRGAAAYVCLPAGKRTLPSWFNAVYINYDWPGSDSYLHGYLSEQGRARFTGISENTLC